MYNSTRLAKKKKKKEKLLPAIKYRLNTWLNPVSSLHFQCLICKMITLNTTQHLFLRIRLWLLYYRTIPKEFEPTSGFARQWAKAKCQQAHFPSNSWHQQESGVRGLADHSTKRYRRRHCPTKLPCPRVSFSEAGSHPWQVRWAPVTTMQHLQA